MPIYEYQSLGPGCPHCEQRFEVFQHLSEPALDRCPHCQQPCRRLISAPNLAVGSAHLLKEKHFSEHGFSQYRRTEKGKYEKTAGPGPERISGD